ncbi:hypothetical protein [Arthrobacter castelli]|uniref:hypothetical protein n=1 Tax=Arthrobacter castelli TaxID=271431 RepID=UPI0004276EE4|nr:hypothetical protein [Arthrobacter castelli]
MTGGVFRGRNLAVLVLVVLLLAAGLLAFSERASQVQALAAQQQKIDQLSSELKHQQQRNAEAAEQNAFKALGITASRLDEDAEVINSLLSMAFTWDSGLEYAQARQSLIERFNLNADGEFLSDFMPPAKFNQDAEGKRYYYIDAAGLNSAVGEDVDIELVKVRATEYRYAVLADIEVSSDAPVKVDAQGEKQPVPTATRRLLLYVTVNGGGEVSDLSGVPASGTTRTSG